MACGDASMCYTLICKLWGWFVNKVADKSIHRTKKWQNNMNFGCALYNFKVFLHQWRTIWWTLQIQFIMDSLTQARACAVLHSITMLNTMADKDDGIITVAVWGGGWAVDKNVCHSGFSWQSLGFFCAKWAPKATWVPSLTGLSVLHLKMNDNDLRI